MKRYLPAGLVLLVHAALAAPPQPVETVTASQELIVEAIRVTGTVTARRHAALSTAVPGLVTAYRVEAGDRVQTGDELLSLDAEVATHARERAGAERREIAARLGDARRRLAEARRLVDQADIAETEVESRRAAVEALEGSLAAAEAEEARQAALVRRHTITAPFAGVVSQREAELGEWVAPGDSLLQLVAIDRPWIDFQVPQDLHARLDTETRIELVIAALGADRTMAGTVLAIVPVNDPAARTFLLRAEPGEPSTQGILPGMSARAILHLDTGRTAVTVPRDALLRYPDGRITVWTVEPGDSGPVASEKRVETGLEFAGSVEVRSGLETGATVIIRGNEALQPGQRVRVR